MQTESNLTSGSGSPVGLGSPRGTALSSLSAKKSFYQGFGDANTRAVELVVAPLLFAFLGFVLVGPALAVVLGVLGFGGATARAYYEYKANMARAEQGKPWASPRAPKSQVTR